MRALVPLIAGLALATAQAESIRVSGSSTMAQAMQAAAPVIKERLGVDLRMDTQAGSSAALQAIGQGTADLAMVTRDVTQEDRAEFPSKSFCDLEVGVQVLVPIVSRETWETSIKSISKADFVSLYEGDVKSWKKFGGADGEVKFYNPERGHGVWELFVGWLYGDVRRAPLGERWESVGTHQSARDSVEFVRGSISLAAPRWADGKHVIALPIREPDGSQIAPTPENFFSRKWPMTRPLHLVTSDKPTGNVRKIMQIMVSPEGEEVMNKVDFTPNPKGRAKLEELLR
jgi:phosphate transport system substrate-binding protein